MVAQMLVFELLGPLFFSLQFCCFITTKLLDFDWHSMTFKFLLWLVWTCFGHFLLLSQTLYYFNCRLMYVNNVEQGHKIFWFFWWPMCTFLTATYIFSALPLGRLSLLVSSHPTLLNYPCNFFYFILSKHPWNSHLVLACLTHINGIEGNKSCGMV